ncbi:MAG: hypothetical protein QOI47_127 [Actinomycetota bacterium]|nr:hypothetical protein [Actinomycetota bacterium]
MFLLTALLGAAAAIHFAAAPAHLAEWQPLGVAFLIGAWAQAALAIWVARTPSRNALVATAAVSGACILTWSVTRSVGLPFGPDAGHAEAVGTADLICTALEVVALVLAVAAIPLRPLVTRLGAGALPALAVVGLATVAVAAPSEHAHTETAVHVHAAGDATELASASTATTGSHDHGTAVATASASTDTTVHDHSAGATAPLAPGATTVTTVHQHDTGATIAVTTPSTVTSSITVPAAHDHMNMGPCSPTPTEQAGADKLLADTLAGLKQWPDLAAAQAAGYLAVTPLGRPLVHYVNPRFLNDGHLVDPARPESLLVAGTTVVGAMYLADSPGQDVPAPGGCLTPWHDHTNLCFAGGKVAGVTASDGTCPAGETNRATAPMLHVWAIPRPNGPFSTIG